MSYAYSELYVDLAQRVMGDMLDYAVNTLGYGIDEFYRMFMVSGMAHQFEMGNPTYVAGKNGCEVAREVVEDCTDLEIETEDIMYVDKSVEYWIGWSLAYYQWQTDLTFKEINRFSPIEDMYGMYDVLHEADISLFIEIMEDKRHSGADVTALKRLRAYAGMSQKMLSDRSDVPLRQIQLFEQGQRDIRKTQGITLYRLSKALNCSMEDLIV